MTETEEREQGTPQRELQGEGPGPGAEEPAKEGGADTADDEAKQQQGDER